MAAQARAPTVKKLKEIAKFWIYFENKTGFVDNLDMEEGEREFKGQSCCPSTQEDGTSNDWQSENHGKSTSEAV